VRAADAGIYRIEQQFCTVELRGPNAPGILAQTCGVNFSAEPAGRIVYTRIAGVSCGVIVLDDQARRTYRVWVDYTLAPYLWETFVQIVREL
jgi:sarcosine oxidase gamma subunit